MMTTRKMKIYSPNFKLAETKALEFLKLSDSKELPIKIIQFKNIFDDLEVKKFSWYAKKMGLTIEETCKQLETEDGLITINPRNNKFRILYNDTIENEGRKRWTLAHELGHYALNHLERMNVSTLRRSETIEDKENPFEKEANCFARNLLAPPYVVFHFSENNPSIIEHICKVSSEAASNIYSFLKRGVQEFGIGYPKEYAEKLGFNHFLNSINNQYHCKGCNSIFTIPDPFHCPCCGSKVISKTLFKLGDDFKMKYPGIEVDNKGRALRCPSCDNEELNFEGDYCSTCSSYLVNVCANTEIDAFSTSTTCNKLLHGNARYCYKCGNESTFFQLGYLMAWNRDDTKLPF